MKEEENVVEKINNKDFYCLDYDGELRGACWVFFILFLRLKQFAAALIFGS